MARQQKYMVYIASYKNFHGTFQNFLWDLPPHKAQNIRKKWINMIFKNSYMTNLAQRRQD